MMRFAVVLVCVIAFGLANTAAAAPETVYWDLDLRPTSQTAQEDYYKTTLIRPGDFARLAASPPADSRTPPASTLIPPKDEFGLPAPVWLFELLLPATFFLHVLFMKVTLGTALLAIPLTMLARTRPHVNAALNDLYSAWPIAMSLTITTGIAPLLFVQVLYGHFFFVSSILLGWWWLAILIALLAAFYGIYVAKAAIGQGADATHHAQRPPSALHWAALAVIALACVFIAAMFTANTTLMLLPDAWKQVHENRQFGWTVHPMFWPRLAHNLIGSLAVTGMFIAVRARVGRSQDHQMRLKVVSFGLLIALIATCVQVADGIWFVVTIFHDVKHAFHQYSPGTILWALAVLTAIALLMTLFRGLDHPERPGSVWIPAGLLAFILVGMSAGRERVRVGMLERHARALYESADVRPQTFTVILFFITLVAGLALIGLMVRWMFTAPRNAATLPP